MKFIFHKILEIVNYENWEQREKYWIKYGREQGWPLVNKSKGGYSRSDIVLTVETREKMSKSHLGSKGFKHSNKTRKKISDSKKELV